MSELVDKTKLLQCIDQNVTQSNGSSASFGVTWLSRQLMSAIENGSLNPISDQQELIEQLQRDYADERATHNSHVTELLKAEEEIKRLTKALQDVLEDMGSSGGEDSFRIVVEALMEGEQP